MLPDLRHQSRLRFGSHLLDTSTEQHFLPCCAAESHKADMNVEWVIGEARPAD